MKLIDFLSRGWDSDMKICNMKEQIEHLNDRMTTLNSCLPSNQTAYRKGGLLHDWTDTVAEIEDTKHKLVGKIRKELSIRTEIAQVISTVHDDKLRSLLEYRYINLKSWQDIAEAMGYEQRYCFKLHAIAIAALETANPGRWESG